LCRYGAKLLLRCPIVPGINDQEEHFKAITLLSQKYSAIVAVEILPYHDYAKGKWEAVGKENILKDLPSANDLQIETWQKKLIEFGCTKLML